jgi:hypothetical protein
LKFKRLQRKFISKTLFIHEIDTADTSYCSKYVTVLGREVKPEPSEAGADDELDLEDTTTTSSSLELPMFFLQVRKKLVRKCCRSGSASFWEAGSGSASKSKLGSSGGSKWPLTLTIET